MSENPPLLDLCKINFTDVSHAPLISKNSKNSKNSDFISTTENVGKSCQERVGNHVSERKCLPLALDPANQAVS